MTILLIQATIIGTVSKPDSTAKLLIFHPCHLPVTIHKKPILQSSFLNVHFHTDFTVLSGIRPTWSFTFCAGFLTNSSPAVELPCKTNLSLLYIRSSMINQKYWLRKYRNFTLFWSLLTGMRRNSIFHFLNIAIN